MDEIIITIVGLLGTAITAAVGWLIRKGLNYLDKKTKILDAESEVQKKESLKNKIVDVATLAVRSTLQTYVDEIKAKKADGKLTREEKNEALRQTLDKTVSLLKQEGIEVGREMLEVVIEAVVGKLRKEEGKNGARGGAAA